jgi:isoamylase
MDKKIKYNYNVMKGKTFPLGVSKERNMIQFTVSVPNASECRLNLYLIGQEELSASILLDQSVRTGSVFSVIIENLPYDNYEYMYEVNGKEFMDPYAKKINGRKEWGKILNKQEESRVRGGLIFQKYDWENDSPLCLPFSDTILYQLHVRGFTKHNSSKVKNKGTFKGISEKIPYLKELGVNGLVVMPMYEFNEIVKDQISNNSLQPFVNFKEKVDDSVKINYWGYGKGCNYFSPKLSFSSEKKHPEKELKDLVKELHKNGIELIMEMYFEDGTNGNMILDCLRYWTLEYHVDGFRINDEVAPAKLVGTEPLLHNTKLLASSWNSNDIYESNTTPTYKHLAEYNEGFLVGSRRFLKSDEGQIGNFINCFKKNPSKVGVINYITNINGFTLMDLVSYDIKHNEDNGENGSDGTEYNYSWNCGVEGKTRRKNIISLRRKQIKNALLMLILSQGTPMLLSGDEFGNTAGGNNNAYCQDNAISWLNWNDLSANQDIFIFLKELIQLRKEHKILHMTDEFRVVDYISCGCPDISFHGTKAWYPDFSNYSRVLGIMLCGNYAKTDKNTFDDDFYFAFNMHWDPHEFDLPSIPNKRKWRVLINTSDEKGEDQTIENQKKYLVKPRSMLVLVSFK